LIRPPKNVSHIEVKVEASVNPSEDSEKVISAITEIVEKCSPEFRYGSRVIARTSGSEPLNTIYQQARSRSALGVLRRMLLDNRSSNSTWFLLNKQAATAGIVVVIEEDQESPLGPIRVTIDSDNLDTLIDWLAPDIE